MNDEIQNIDAAPDDVLKEVCSHCGASMVQYIYELDVLNVILLTAMACEVRRRMEEYKMDFTLANQVHVPTLPVSHGTKCRTTQSAKLGLIVKMQGKGSRGVWAITKRGFAALRGEPVPAQVKVFRNQIVDRMDKLITLDEAKRLHIEKVNACITAGRDPKRDHRKDLEGYNSSDFQFFSFA